jgi:hypothetical protein
VIKRLFGYAKTRYQGLAKKGFTVQSVDWFDQFLPFAKTVDD